MGRRKKILLKSTTRRPDMTKKNSLSREALPKYRGQDASGQFINLNARLF